MSAEGKASFVGKHVDFCESELYGIQRDAQIAADLDRQAHAMAMQAVEGRRLAVGQAIAFALKRVGAPAGLPARLTMKDGLPVGFTIVEPSAKKAPKASAKVLPMPKKAAKS